MPDAPDPGFNVGSSNNAPFRVDPSSIMTGRTAIVASSGYGKSNLIAVLCEELCDRNLPFVIVDIEGGFHTLKEKAANGRGEVVWIGSDKDCDFPISPAVCKEVAAEVVKDGGRVVFDVSQRQDAPDLVGAILSSLFDAEDHLQEQDRVPVLVVLDEVQRFVPQDRSVNVRQVTDLSTLGRKRGLGMVVATQRPALVDKTVLAQCNNQFVGHLGLKNDLDAVKTFFAASPQASTLVADLTGLERGCFFAVGELSPTIARVKARARTTTALGTTPTVKTGKANFAEMLKGKLQGGTPAPAASTPATPTGPGTGAVAPAAPATAPATSVSPRAPGAVPSSSTRAAAPAAPAAPATARAPPVPQFAGLAFSPQVTLDTAAEVVQSHRIHPGHLLQFVFNGKMHTTQPEAVLWPFLQLNLEWVPPKRFLGKSQPVSITTLWDPRLARFVKFDGGDLVPAGSTYAASLLALPWESLRVLRALSAEREPVSATDLSAKVSGVGVQKIVSALTALSGSGLVQTAPNAQGPRKAALYSTGLRLEELDPRRLDSAPPRTDVFPAAAGVVPLPIDARGTEASVRALLSGLCDMVSVVRTATYWYPFYRVVLEPPGQGTFTRTVLVSGITAKAMVLDGDDAMRALQ
jgi:hypothetical protein